jgi:4-amino-4-deoxy-L-arabinose transferase-like glycosyltransferase
MFVGAALLVVVAMCRIISTYWVFNHTMDEPTHIACGLEWLTEHAYTYELQHPPLARIAAAIGPWFAGAPNVPKSELPSQNPLVLYNSPSYYRSLASARAGELPFFILAAGVVWLWAKYLYGYKTAIVAVGIYTCIPAVLAHAGLATTDMAIGATLPAAVYAFVRWLDEASYVRGVVLGLAIAAGLLSKFTFLLFFPVCVLVILGIRFGRMRFSRDHVASLALTCGVCFVLVWGAYWFRITPLPKHEAISLPGVEVLLGIQEARDHNRDGHLTYLLGKQSKYGWWYFFPVVLLYKTPLALLVLVILSCVWLRGRPREQFLPLACAAAILLSVLPSHINLGIRHILPIFAFLSIPAAMALVKLFDADRRILRVAGAGLALWYVSASVLAHPDYLAYFNELAAGEPENIRVDSDLDWGQNVERLARRARELGINEQIGFAWFGSVDPSKHGLNWYPASAWEPASGWVAVSATAMMLWEEKSPTGSRKRPWSWLDEFEPLERVGGSILLYHIDEKPFDGKGKPR